MAQFEKRGLVGLKASSVCDVVGYMRQNSLFGKVLGKIKKYWKLEYGIWHVFKSSVVGLVEFQITL